MSNDKKEQKKKNIDYQKNIANEQLIKMNLHEILCSYKTDELDCTNKAYCLIQTLNSAKILFFCRKHTKELITDKKN